MLRTVKQSKLKSKISLSLVTVAALCALNLPTAYAEGVSLSTFPTTLQLRSQAPADVRSGFSIQNKGSETVKLNIQIRPFRAAPSNDGKVAFVEGNDPALLKRVQIIDNGFAVSSIELGPKQTKNLGLQVKLEQREAITDYYFSILFLTSKDNPKEESGSDVSVITATQAGIGLNVLLAAGPKELPQGQIEEFSTPASFRNAGPVPFSVKIRNMGPHYMTPKGVILIRNIFGQTVGRIDLQNTNILAGTSRSMIGTPYRNTAKNNPSVPADYNEQKALENAAAVWPEKFLLGIYTADLSLALSEEGPVFNRSIRFIAFPSKLLLALGIVMLLGILIALRIRRKLKDI